MPSDMQMYASTYVQCLAFPLMHCGLGDICIEGTMPQSSPKSTERSPKSWATGFQVHDYSGVAPRLASSEPFALQARCRRRQPGAGPGAMAPSRAWTGRPKRPADRNTHTRVLYIYTYIHMHICLLMSLHKRRSGGHRSRKPRASSQRAHYSLIKDYTSNDARVPMVPDMIYGISSLIKHTGPLWP